MGHYFFRLMGEETHELPFKVKRIIPGGVVAIFGEVQACLSGQLLPLIFVLGGSSRNGKAGPVISASCLMESNSRKWACGERQRYCPCRLCPRLNWAKTTTKTLSSFEARGGFRHFPFPVASRLSGRGAYQLRIIHANDGQSGIANPRPWGILSAGPFTTFLQTYWKDMNRTLQNRLLHGSLCLRLFHGEMAERFNAAVLKTAVGQPTVGSNPTLSAKLL